MARAQEIEQARFLLLMRTVASARLEKEILATKSDVVHHARTSAVCSALMDEFGCISAGVGHRSEEIAFQDGCVAGGTTSIDIPDGRGTRWSASDSEGRSKQQRGFKCPMQGR